MINVQSNTFFVVENTGTLDKLNVQQIEEFAEGLVVSITDRCTYWYRISTRKLFRILVEVYDDGSTSSEHTVPVSVSDENCFVSTAIPGTVPVPSLK
jgi:hypothetical protein